jgi:hypothetical protein
VDKDKSVLGRTVGATAFCLCEPVRCGSILHAEENPRAGKNHSLLATVGNTLAVRSLRKWCRRCGGHVLTEHPGMGLTDVYAAVLEGFPFKPAVHVHYRETVLPIRDGLPKYRDLPAEAGGSGEQVAE